MNKLKKIIKSKCPKIYDSWIYFKMTLRYYKKKNTKPENYGREIEKLYKKVTNQRLDLQCPRTYTEKIQWLKINELVPLRTQLADKVEVRKWIEEKIGNKYLIPVCGIYDNFDDINFSELPNKFVLKTNHAAGWNIIVDDKTKFDYKKAKKKINKWLKINYAFWSDFEMHYSPIQPKIIIEQFINDSNGELNDFKFLCFNGNVKYCWVDLNRHSNHKRNVYDLNWNLQPWNQYSYGNYLGEVSKPQNFDKMVEIAHILCQGFKHVRVDLYNVDGKIYFGEMTFTNGSGYEKITPESYNLMLGDMIPIK